MLEQMAAHTPPWLKCPNAEMPIAVSSRIRLARNLEDLPFPHRCSDEQLNDAISRISNAAESTTLLASNESINRNTLSSMERELLVERHLASPEFVATDTPGALLINQDESCALMINEEDTIRMQLILPGLQLNTAWDAMDALDTELEEHLPYAFSTRFGYLTACPTNVGTGLRASVMLHLPALVHEHKIGSVISTVGKAGIAVRGLYGEHSDARGNMFQISNQATLGRSETDIVQQLHHIVSRIIEHEMQQRKKLIEKTPHVIRNDVGRAYGTLKYAEILPSEEATSLLSTLLMGVDLRVLDSIDRATLCDLLIHIQPAHLQKLCGGEKTREERDIARARLIRKRLGEE